jgi:hypothetical protein
MSLVYIDFRSASYRNILVCKELLNLLLKCESNKKQQIIHKIYYLSGYIIEFCYKFALFHSLKLDKFENIYLYGSDEFKKKWKEHDFQKLKILCNENKVNFSSDIPYFGNSNIDKKSKSLIDSWNVQIRYSLKLSKPQISNITEEDINKFLQIIEEILNKITTKFS